MRIAAIETFPVVIPLKDEFRMVSALGSHDVSHYVIVRVITAEGMEGIGEATVAPRWSGETVWSCQALIRHVLEPALVDHDPTDVANIDRIMNVVASHNWFAKAAIEMACWDLAGKQQGKPVYELLGGACRDRTITSRFSMGAYDPDRARRRAGELVEMGFDTIKVKVGGPPDIDVTRVRTVREVIGPDRKLVVDANCGWDAETAITALHAMADCNVSLIEQPTPRDDLESMARVRAAVEPPVMADDSCFDLAQARELIRHDCCQVLSVYPGKNGGILRSKQIVDYAQQHGVACTIGSNLELDIAAAAMGHLIIACPNMKVEQFAGDIYGPAYHETPVVLDPLAIDGPRITIPDQPGLGVDPDWDTIRSLSG